MKILFLDAIRWSVLPGQYNGHKAVPHDFLDVARKISNFVDLEFYGLTIQLHSNVRHNPIRFALRV